MFLLVLSAGNFCKQFVPRSGPTKHWAWPESDLFDTQMVVLKELFYKVDFEEKKSAGNNKAWKITRGGGGGGGGGGTMS